MNALDEHDPPGVRPPKARGLALSIKGRALRLLSQREHSRHELVRKLKAHEAAPGDLAQALDELQAKGFIDEQRVLESVVNTRSRKLGAARVRQELQAKGLPSEAIRAAVQTLRSSELERAQAVWQKKFGSPAADPAAQAKQARFLLSRGFASEVVRQLVRPVGHQEVGQEERQEVSRKVSQEVSQEGGLQDL